MTDKKKKKVISTTKKTVGTTSKKKVVGKEKAKLKPTQSKRKRSGKASSMPSELLYKRENFKWILIGLVFIIVGFALMTGGGMPSPDVWDDSLIYSHRRITIAPIVILIGLGIEVYAIFK